MFPRLALNLGSSRALLPKCWYYRNVSPTMLGLETLIFTSTSGHVLCLPDVEVNIRGSMPRLNCPVSLQRDVTYIITIR